MMKNTLAAAVVVMLTSMAAAHEMSPTYPVLKSSFVSGIKTTEMSILNKRSDIDYYKIDVFDKDWNPIKFVSNKPATIKVGYMKKAIFNLYIKNEDALRVEYICSLSRALKNDIRSTSVQSRICSRVSNSQ
jgi:opacity protein-like surface antigen